jgi:hypothetical protein
VHSVKIFYSGGGRCLKEKGEERREREEGRWKKKQKASLFPG